MERDSILYKMRRKMQVVAHNIISDELMSKFYYRIVVKKKLSFDNPQTFNEKLQWMKLYYYPNNPIIIKCSDKFSVRQYIKEKGYENLLVPLIGKWERAEDIRWEKLPNRFVLKCNHGCAYNILCDDKSIFDTKKAEIQLNRWLDEDFGAFNIELHYSKIKPRLIICEEYLGSNITDYKFFCFNGEPRFIYVSNDLVHDRQAQIGFFNLDGSKMPLRRGDYADIPKVNLPEYFDEMLCAAKKLCEDFPFVRVDFFVNNNKYYFAELTFTPSACMMPFEPDKYDFEWGTLLDISELMKGCNN